MKSILDPSFKYVSSVATDIRKTFARVRREHRKVERLEARARRRAEAAATSNSRSAPDLLEPAAALGSA